MRSTKIASKPALLRRAIASGCVVMPGAFNAAAARLIEGCGVLAVCVSGARLANATAGVPDIGLLTLSEVSQLAGYVADAVSIPTLADADTGFGGPENVARTVQTFERIGLAGMHLEDQEFPKRCGHLSGKTLVSPDQMSEKIRAAISARRDKDCLIVARTAIRVAMHVVESCLSDLKQHGTKKEWIGRMQSREDLYKLLNYHVDGK